MLVVLDIVKKSQYQVLTQPYLSKDGMLGTLAYREFFWIYREIFEKLNFFHFFSKKKISNIKLG